MKIAMNADKQKKNEENEIDGVRANERERSK